MAAPRAEISALVAALRTGDAAAKEAAVREMMNLTMNPANRVAIAEEGGIPPLIELVRDGSAGARALAVAAGALLCLAKNDANKEAIANRFLSAAKKGVSKGAKPDHVRFAPLPRNFKGVVKLPDLKEEWIQQLKK